MRRERQNPNDLELQSSSASLSHYDDYDDDDDDDDGGDDGGDDGDNSKPSAPGSVYAAAYMSQLLRACTDQWIMIIKSQFSISS